MIVEAYLDERALIMAVKCLFGLPTHLRPTTHSYDEESTSPRDIDMIEALETIAQSETGFFLFGRDARYSIRVSPKRGFCGIEADSAQECLPDSDALLILEALAQGGATFAYAATENEFVHRNRHSWLLKDGTVESWLGRDLRKYLPGVYWANALSSPYAPLASRCHREIGTKYHSLPNGTIMIWLYERSEEWRLRAEIVDRWIAQQPEVFSKLRVLPELDAASDLSSVLAASDKYP
jgi:hypothetical protein